MEKVDNSRKSVFCELDYASIKNLNQKATASESALKNRPLTNDETQQAKLNPGEAELWQINTFFQREKELQPNTELVLHAERVNYKRADGAKVEKIRFYARPKSEKTEKTEQGFFAFFDNLINQGKKNHSDQNQADNTVADLAKAYMDATGVTASRPTLHSSLDRLIQRSASAATGSIAPDLMVVATAIGNEKFKNPTGLALAKKSDFRDAVLAELNISHNGCPIVAEQRMLEDLASFGFQKKEVIAFQQLVDNIVSNKNTDEEDLYAIGTFRKQWIAFHDSKSPAGQKFRDFVWDNSTCQVWNTVAHRLAERPAPTFDFNAHAKGDVIMVPEVEHIQTLPGESTLREIVDKLHSDASKENQAQFTKINSGGGKVLVAAKSCHIDEMQYQLRTTQHAYLKQTYESVFGHKAASAETIILTPLFNYTEDTIDECIDIMLAPAKKERKPGENLRLGIFTPDPRIRLKFNTAVHKLADEKRKKKNERQAGAKGSAPDTHQVQEMTEPKTQTANSPAIQEWAVENMRQMITEGIETFKQHADFMQSTAATTVTTSVDSATAAAAATVATFTTQGYEALKGSLLTPTPKQIFREEHVDAHVMHSTMPLVKPDTLPPVAAAVIDAKKESGLLTVTNALSDLFSRGSEYDAAVVLERLPRMQLKKKRRGKEVPVADIAAAFPQKATSSHSGTRAEIGIEYVKLQNGITGQNWRPDEKTVILLSDSADECVQPGQTDIKSELQTLLKRDDFSTFFGTGLIFKPQSLKNDNSHNHNRYFAFPEKLSADATAEIAQRYREIITQAARMEIHKVVVTPCFELPRIFIHQDAYGRAIVTMLKTLDELSMEFPSIDITLIGRSEAEHALMQDAIEAITQKKQAERLKKNY
ncbi:hypothetical protein KTQ42_07680|uniref:hypothetical protein n=1 Tax=Noviherbaspirillum sp. L7-7A TaxID=2850560 RepID=UPI001C2B7CC9|nr:hypothetical protein [Noviherbaspirillum sp. L7-7A]MBV0879181.1 hypothetical protein [Noviherbaspirillum sp. L7-7A]